jgi:hypothetical protein
MSEEQPETSSNSDVSPAARADGGLPLKNIAQKKNAAMKDWGEVEMDSGGLETEEGESMSVPRFKKLESGRESLATALVDYVSFRHRDQGGAGPVQQIPPPISDDGP